MLSLLDITRVQRLLCMGAHCDDIEIGAGGTIMRLAKAYPQIEVRWVILAGEDPMRVEEAAPLGRGFSGRHRRERNLDLWISRWVSAFPRRTGQGGLRGSQGELCARPHPDAPR